MIARAGIDFIVAGGHEIGLGHVVRSATLAVETKRRGWSTRCFLEGDDAARAKWRELTGHDVDGDWTGFRGADRPRACLAALDFPFAKSAWLDRLSREPHRVLVIDDERTRRGVDWIVLPGLHHRATTTSPTSQRSEGAHRLSGPRYAILPRAHRELTSQEKTRPPRILLSMGGADPHRFTPALAAPLRNAARTASQNALDQPWAIDVVFGPAFDDPGDRVARGLEESGMTVHRSPTASEMALLMSRVRFAIIGFGTSLTELAWHRTPFLSVPHHDHDIAPARDLEARGIGRLLATPGEVFEDARVLETRIASALLDPTWQRESARVAHAALEGGHGVSRIVDQIESILLRSRSTKDGSHVTPAAARPIS